MGAWAVGRGTLIQIKASEMLVAPRISECFGLPWCALVCLYFNCQHYNWNCVQSPWIEMSRLFPSCVHSELLSKFWTSKHCYWYISLMSVCTLLPRMSWSKVICLFLYDDIIPFLSKHVSRLWPDISRCMACQWEVTSFCPWIPVLLAFKDLWINHSGTRGSEFIPLTFGIRKEWVRCFLDYETALGLL